MLYIEAELYAKIYFSSYILLRLNVSPCVFLMFYYSTGEVESKEAFKKVSLQAPRLTFPHQLDLLQQYSEILSFYPIVFFAKFFFYFSLCFVLLTKRINRQLNLLLLSVYRRKIVLKKVQKIIFQLLTIQFPVLY